MENVEEKSNLNCNPLFRDLNSDDTDPEVTEIESLCLECGQNGLTRIFLTKIPYYKEVALMSFECSSCNYKNNEIQNAGKIGEKGIKYILKVNSSSDLNRQVVKSDYTSISIPHLDFEVPALSQKGEITTVEGIIIRCLKGLEQDQERRKQENPEIAERISQFIDKLKLLTLANEPYTVVFEDISGNCHVQNPNAPQKDNNCSVSYFKRTTEQNHVLGIYSEHDDVLLDPINEEDYSYDKIKGEVVTFPTNCPECNSPCETNMKMTNIPYFKEVIIMATVCDKCGHRSNEVKSGCGIEPQGVKIEVQVFGPEDFNRDLLKSETCHLSIPEIELDLGPTTLGGRFTTVEGLISSINEQLSKSTALTGDSADPEIRRRMDNFLTQLDLILQGKKNITLILDDPAGNSYVQSLNDNNTTDQRLKIVKYNRTYEQNEELGINDMKVDNY